MILYAWLKTWIALLQMKWAVDKQPYLLVWFTPWRTSCPVINLTLIFFSLHFWWWLAKILQIERISSVSPHNKASAIDCFCSRYIIIITGWKQICIIDICTKLPSLAALSLLFLNLIYGFDFFLLRNLRSIGHHDWVSSPKVSRTWSVGSTGSWWNIRWRLVNI